jgi:hypothetical protein
MYSYVGVYVNDSMKYFWFASTFVFNDIQYILYCSKWNLFVKIDRVVHGDCGLGQVSWWRFGGTCFAYIMRRLVSGLQNWFGGTCSAYIMKRMMAGPRWWWFFWVDACVAFIMRRFFGSCRVIRLYIQDIGV